MNNARIRLVVTAVLFLGWIGWLAYLAATTTRPVVLSRPQFLVSTLDVIAQVEGDHPALTVTVVEVHWPPGQEDWKGKVITVINLPACEGWHGPDTYILPLVKDGERFQVASLPTTPGYGSSAGALPPRERIYPLTAETRRQLDSIQKPDHSR